MVYLLKMVIFHSFLYVYQAGYLQMFLEFWSQMAGTGWNIHRKKFPMTWTKGPEIKDLLEWSLGGETTAENPKIHAAMIWLRIL